MKPTRRILLSATLSAFLCAIPIGATAAADGLPSKVPETAGDGRVARVVDGDTLVLEGGAQVRLTGIQAPKLPLGRPGFAAWPLAGEAKRALESLSLGKRVALSYDGRRIDRWRRLLAQVRTADVWLQQEMLRLGMARVYTFPDNASRAADLYAAEQTARAARRGIWALAWYRIRTPEEAGRRIGTFQLVEGIPVAAAVVRGRGYLNYGGDWRTDFTVSVAPGRMKAFRRAGIDLKSLSGKRIRVRGWVVRENGAMIRATHPEQMEVLDK